MKLTSYRRTRLALAALAAVTLGLVAVPASPAKVVSHTFTSPLKNTGDPLANGGTFTLHFKTLGGLRPAGQRYGYNGLPYRVMKTKYLIEDVIVSNLPFECFDTNPSGEPTRYKRTLSQFTLPINKVATILWTPPHWIEPFPPGKPPLGEDPSGEVFNTLIQANEGSGLVPGFVGGNVSARGLIGKHRKFLALVSGQLVADRYTICGYYGEAAEPFHFPL